MSKNLKYCIFLFSRINYKFDGKKQSGILKCFLYISDYFSDVFLVNLKLLFKREQKSNLRGKKILILILGFMSFSS